MKQVLFILGILFIVASCNDSNVAPCPNKPQQDNSSPQTSFKLLENHAVKTGDTLVVEHTDKDGSETVYLKRIH